jgi:(4-alkanoyl-5-oxo-2,5-dihydrofuran-3-yl)methyl phosphate reductase
MLSLMTMTNEESGLIVVTGATGTVGSEVVRRLAAAGHRVRAVVRDDAAAAGTLGPGVELAPGDLSDPGALEQALTGATRMYLLSPMVPELPVWEAGAIAAAERAGIRHLVKHSNIGAADDAASRLQRWHRAGEKLIENSAMAWTFVRPTGFMTNALAWAGTIRAQGAVYWTGGDGRVAVVDPRDIAAVAVAALTGPGYDGKAYDITGPQPLSNAEQTAAIAGAIGRPLRYVDIPENAARDSMLSMGMPAEIVEGLLEFTAGMRTGPDQPVSGAVPDVTGHPARTFTAWAAENAAAFG